MCFKPSLSVSVGQFTLHQTPVSNCNQFYSPLFWTQSESNPAQFNVKCCGVKKCKIIWTWILMVFSLNPTISKNLKIAMYQILYFTADCTQSVTPSFRRLKLCTSLSASWQRRDSVGRKLEKWIQPLSSSKLKFSTFWPVKKAAPFSSNFLFPKKKRKNYRRRKKVTWPKRKRGKLSMHVKPKPGSQHRIGGEQTNIFSVPVRYSTYLHIPSCVL